MLNANWHEAFWFCPCVDKMAERFNAKVEQLAEQYIPKDKTFDKQE